MEMKHQIYNESPSLVIVLYMIYTVCEWDVLHISCYWPSRNARNPITCPHLARVDYRFISSSSKTLHNQIKTSFTTLKTLR